MKSLFLTICIAALATQASARPWAAFYCGKLQVALIPSKYFDPSRGSCDRLCDGKTHYFDMQKDPDERRPLSNRLFRTNDDGDLFYKSKKCQAFDEDDYDALDTPGMSRREIARQRRLRLLSVPEPSPVPTTCVPHPTLEGYQVCGQTPFVAFGQNPLASTADQQPRGSAKPLFLTIKSDLTLALGNDPIARDALGSSFNAATGGDKDALVYLRADRTVPYDELMRIMELLRAAGYFKFHLVGSTVSIIEFAPVPTAPPLPSEPELNAAEWGRAAIVRGRAAKTPVSDWKYQIVVRLEQNTRYPEEAQSRREQGVAHSSASTARGGCLRVCVVRSSGANALDEEALALLQRAAPFPPPPSELGGDHIDLTVPIRFNLTQPASSNQTRPGVRGESWVPSRDCSLQVGRSVQAVGGTISCGRIRSASIDRCSIHSQYHAGSGPLLAASSEFHQPREELDMANDILADIVSSVIHDVVAPLIRPTSQQIFNLRVAAGIDFVRISFQTVQPTIPVITCEASDGSMTFAFPIFGGMRTKHESILGESTPLQQDVNHLLRIVAAGRDSQGHPVEKFATGNFTTGSRHATIKFDSIKVRNDSDSGGNGELTLFFTGGDADNGVLMGGPLEWPYMDINDDDPPAVLNLEIQIHKAPRRLWAAVSAYDSRRFALFPSRGGLKQCRAWPGVLVQRRGKRGWVFRRSRLCKRHPCRRHRRYPRAHRIPNRAGHSRFRAGLHCQRSNPSGPVCPCGHRDAAPGAGL